MAVFKGDRNVRALVDLFVAVVFICFLQQYSQLPRVFNNITMVSIHVFTFDICIQCSDDENLCYVPLFTT
jgi:hypothetical protein